MNGSGIIDGIPVELEVVVAVAVEVAVGDTVESVAFAVML